MMTTAASFQMHALEFLDRAPLFHTCPIRPNGYDGRSHEAGEPARDLAL